MEKTSLAHSGKRRKSLRQKSHSKNDNIGTSAQQELYVICHNIRSLHNVGSIFRTAEGARVTKIYLCGYTGKPPRIQIAKVALGAENLVPWEYCRHTWRVIKELRKKQISIVSLEYILKTSTDFHKYTPKFPLALILGNEVRGIPKNLLEKSDAIIHIPMQGKKKSLNVSVAFGIALYELNRWRRH